MEENIQELLAIKDYEGLYQISNIGMVKSFPRKHTNGGLLKSYLLSNGYHRIVLCKNSVPKAYSVHRLVAQTFIPNPLNLPEVNHKNGIKTDNRVENLEWCTRKNNSLHASKHNLYHPAKGENHPYSKLKEFQVKEIRKKYSTNNYTHLQLANEYSISDGTIYAIIHYKTWKNV
jgi:hypothetical protein